MKRNILILITLIAVGCSSVAQLSAKKVGFATGDDCSNYTITKNETVTDSVRIHVKLKSCKFDESIFGALLIRDSNSILSKFETDVNGNATIVLKKGSYSIQFASVNFKSLQIPLKKFRNGDYTLSLNATFADPIIN